MTALVAPGLVAAGAAALTTWLLVPPPRPLVGLPRAGRVVPAGASVVVLLVALPSTWLVPGLVLTAASAVGRSLWRRRRSAANAAANAVRLTEVYDLLAAELAAGRSAEAALDEAAAAWPALRPVAEACRLGGDVPAALRHTAATPGAGTLRLLAAAWTVSQRTGGALGPVTRRVAESVRREQAMRRVVTAELASARATARLVACLPLVALLMGSGAGGDPWTFLLRTPAGWACLAAGVALGLAGLWWIDQIATAVER